MYDRHKKGLIGELKVITYLVENDYEVYTPVNDNAKFDLIASKDGKLLRVSVKSTSEQKANGRYNVELRNISRRNNGEINISYSNDFDILVVYIISEDRIVIIESHDIVAKTRLVV